MKRRYQIEKQRAVNEFRQLAANENPNIQMILPMADNRRSSAARCRTSAARGGIGSDELGNGRGSAPCGGRAAPAA